MILRVPTKKIAPAAHLPVGNGYFSAILPLHNRYIRCNSQETHGDVVSTVAPVNDTHTYVCARVQESRGSSVQTQSGPQRRRKSFFTSAVHYYVISGCRRLQLKMVREITFNGGHHDKARRARFVEPSLEPRPCQPAHRAEHASAVRRV